MKKWIVVFTMYLKMFSPRLFLLRDSQSNPKAFVLTLCHHQKIKHFQILPVSRLFLILITKKEILNLEALPTSEENFLLITEVINRDVSISKYISMYSLELSNVWLKFFVHIAWKTSVSHWGIEVMHRTCSLWLTATSAAVVSLSLRQMLNNSGKL